MRDADPAGVTSVFERDGAADGDRVLAETAVNREVAPEAFRGSRDVVDDLQQRIGWAGRDQRRLAHCGAGFNEEIERVVVRSQGRDFSAVVPGQIFPVPAGTVLWSNEVTLIADDVTFDALHARSNDARRDIVDCFEVVAVIEAGGDRWIAATVNDQVTMHDARSVRSCGGIN